MTTNFHVILKKDIHYWLFCLILTYKKFHFNHKYTPDATQKMQDICDIIGIKNPYSWSSTTQSKENQYLYTYLNFRSNVLNGKPKYELNYNINSQL